MAASQFRVSVLLSGGYLPRTAERYDRYGVRQIGIAHVEWIIVNRIWKTKRFSCFKCVMSNCRHVRAVREFVRTQCSEFIGKPGETRQCKRHGAVYQDQKYWCEYHSPIATLLRQQQSTQRGKLSWACTMAHGPVHEAEQRVLRVVRALNDPSDIVHGIKDLDASLAALKTADETYAISRKRFDDFNRGLKR